MPSGQFVCEVCKRLGKDPVKMPNDSIGIELMKAHLDEHRRDGELE